MPRINPLHWKVLECIFLACGFVFARQASSHRVYEREGTLRPVIIPAYDAVSATIISGLLRTAGLSREDFFRYLEGCK